MVPTRRDFLKASTAGGVVASMLGFDLAPAYAEMRALKIARASETRSTCPYCSVSCGVIIHTLGDKAKNVTPQVVHVEGDPDHPINRGTLCPKGASLIDFIHSESRLRYPEYRAAGANEWKRISWEDALDRIAKLMKEDRDANFVETTEDGKKVNRWLTTGMLAASAGSNEVGYLTHKTVRSLGMLAFDNQARV